MPIRSSHNGSMNGLGFAGLCHAWKSDAYMYPSFGLRCAADATGTCCCSSRTVPGLADWFQLVFGCGPPLLLNPLEIPIGFGSCALYAMWFILVMPSCRNACKFHFSVKVSNPTADVALRMNGTCEECPPLNTHVHTRLNV
eukprot:6027147-Amphidinium_carterae.1